MPSARPSATATMTTSSTSEPPADFCFVLTPCVGGALAVGDASARRRRSPPRAAASPPRRRRRGCRHRRPRRSAAAVRRASGVARPRRRVSPSASTASAAAAASASSAPRVVQQPGLDDLLGAGVAALADAGALADALAQVVELRAPHVAAGGDLDLLDLRRVHRERALDADAEGLLADGEGLAGAVALALDDDALEDLRTATRALDDLEVDADAVAGLEVGDAAQLRALEAVDDGAHGEEEPRADGSSSLARAAHGSEPPGRRPTLPAARAPPAADLLVVARQQDVRHAPAAVLGGTRVVRVLRVAARARR